MGHYRKTKKDAASGARVSYTVVRYGKNNDKILYRGWVRRGGSEWRLAAQTKEECEAKVRAKLAELASEGVSAVALSAEEKRDAAKARKLLAEGETLEKALEELRVVRTKLGTGRKLLDALDVMEKARKTLAGRATLEEVVGFWAERNPDSSAVRLGEARNAFVAEAERGGVPSYTSRLDMRLEAFAEWLGGGNAKSGDKRAVVSIEAREMEAFLDYHAQQCKKGRVGGGGNKELRRGSPLAFTDATRNKWIVTFKHFFSWATKKYELAVDPAAKLEKVKLKKKATAIDFLFADDVERLLRAAERVAPEYAPAVAIAFFGGLRPAELVGKYEKGVGLVRGLDWSMVDRDGNLVVDGETTKTKQRRTVPLESNLKAWLDAYAPETREGPVVRNPTAWKNARAAIVEAAGVEWGQDVARHTYSTMHFGKYADRARLEANMGHVVGSGVLEEHYKALVTKKEAARFWSIMPTAEVEE